MTDLLTALALVLVIEGLVLTLVPEAPRRLLQHLSELPPAVLRLGGVSAVALGTFCVWLLRG